MIRSVLPKENLSSISLSVIIVNYNVRYFLEQALTAVKKAAEGLSVEVFVIDNHSSDFSANMVRTNFPEIELIANSDNKGFSKANNQAIRKASGKYILLLNPDTVIEEDTFEKIITFMDQHPKAGGLGVKMIDGKGNFLPESKRALPTPWIAFCKIFGLSSLFPKSKTFGQYHLGYLSKDAIHEVEILSGAFMLIRKDVLDEIGLLDETFFMYGEDIDLSYRILKAGYKNYYFPDTTIIHYKGESTKKQTVNYVKVFYNAMIIFAKKHFSSGNAKAFSFLITLAIYAKAFLTVIFSIAKNLFLPFLDAAIIYTGMYLLKNFWEHNIKLEEGVVYPETYMSFNVPVYIIIWILTAFFSGGYDRPISLMRLLRGILVGTIFIAAVYGFLEESYRFSRGMILIGGVWAMVSLTLLRLLLNELPMQRFKLENRKDKKRMLIVGGKDEVDRVLRLITQSNITIEYIGYITPSDADEEDDNMLGSIARLRETVDMYAVNEVVFCSKHISSSEIIGWMTNIGAQVDYKIVHAEGDGIIGSNSKNSAGDLYSFDINLNIVSPQNRRNKRVFDIIMCLIFFIGSPIMIYLNGFKFFKNWWRVLIGASTWVGYYDKEDEYIINLPQTKPSIISPVDTVKFPLSDTKSIRRLNLLYAKDYEVYKDLQVLRRSLKKLR